MFVIPGTGSSAYDGGSTCGPGCGCGCGGACGCGDGGGSECGCEDCGAGSGPGGTPPGGGLPGFDPGGFPYVGSGPGSVPSGVPSGGEGSGFGKGSGPIPEEAELQYCLHHADEEETQYVVECPPCGDEGDEPCCGPDMTDDLLRVLYEILANLSLPYSAEVLRPQPGKERARILDLKHYSAPNNYRISSTGTADNESCPQGCPHDCPPQDDPEHIGAEYGCVTLCDQCVEGSVLGNIAYGFRTWNPALSSVADAYAYVVGGEESDKPWDKCAVSIGRLFGRRGGGGRVELCRAMALKKKRVVQVPVVDEVPLGFRLHYITETRGCDIQLCDCRPCPEVKGRYPVDLDPLTGQVVPTQPPN